MAGILDGEGSIIIWRRKEKIRIPNNRMKWVLIVDISNTSAQLMLWIRDSFGGYFRLGKLYPGQNKPVYHWRVTDKKAENMLKRLLSFLIVKRDEAEIALEFRKTFTNKTTWSGHPLPDSIDKFRKEMQIKLKQLKTERA